jgi:hypothetical protein
VNPLGGQTTHVPLASCLTTPSAATVCSVEWWPGQDLKGNGTGLIDTTPTFAWRDWVKPRKLPARITSVAQML